MSMSRRLRVPAEITAYFWAIKGLSTAMGESTSDYLVHTIHPVPAVLLGFAGFLVALALQFSMRRYLAWTYWFAVVMVGVFGTMAADVLHVGLGVPYFASAALYAVALAAVFATWQQREKTLSIHSIDTARRELFYWAAVVATFALGTAAGDLTAYTFHLGYFLSIVLFAGVIAIPAIGYWRFSWNPILAFWVAYVVTRPLGASFADWMGKPVSLGGLGLGPGAGQPGHDGPHRLPGRLSGDHSQRRAARPGRGRPTPQAADSDPTPRRSGRARPSLAPDLGGGHDRLLLGRLPPRTALRDPRPVEETLQSGRRPARGAIRHRRRRWPMAAGCEGAKAISRSPRPGGPRRPAPGETARRSPSAGRQ